MDTVAGRDGQSVYRSFKAESDIGSAVMGGLVRQFQQAEADQ
jgi:hypothetical protein